ncbi:MAG TPA: hypothetical protein V6C72_12315, partial [Chroococcales cyanobacterium]
MSIQKYRKYRKYRKYSVTAQLPVFSLFATMLLCLIGIPAGAADSDSKNSIARLPGGITPIDYKIFVEPELDKGKFTGAETIRVALTKPVREIVLNAADLTIDRVDCEVPGRPGALRLKVAEQPKYETVTLQAPELISSKVCTVVLKFHG